MFGRRHIGAKDAKFLDRGGWPAVFAKPVPAHFDDRGGPSIGPAIDRQKRACQSCFERTESPSILDCRKSF
jgi:hypothetical protein